MGRALLLALALLLSAVAFDRVPAYSAARADPAFVSGVEDLPLMPGLVQNADRSLIFDKPDGRIVEAVAAGAVTRAGVLRFYGETLPELGWTGNGRVFRREGEELKLSFEGRDGALTVRFSLTPR